MAERDPAAPAGRGGVAPDLLPSASRSRRGVLAFRSARGRPLPRHHRPRRSSRRGAAGAGGPGERTRMTVLLLALQIASGQSSATVVYDDLPAEVVRLELFEWTGTRPGARQAVVRGSRRFTLQGHSGRHYVAA